MMLGAVLTLTLFTSAAWAGVRVRPQPAYTRVGTVDTVVVGRVTALEDKDTEVDPLFGGPQKTTFRVARVSISEPLRGLDADKKDIRVAFPPPRKPGPGRPIIPGIGNGVNLQVGQEGLFLLTKHPKENFYVLSIDFDFIAQSMNASLAKEVEQVKRSVKLLADPTAGLKSKDADDRLLTAALLLGKYRTFRPGFQKQAPVDAEESKLILSAVLDADWNRKAVFGELHPQNLFNQLSLTPKDGWTFPPRANAQQLQEAMRAWLKEHRDTYRVQRLVEGPPSP
jgi:hypothetical protein